MYRTALFLLIILIASLAVARDFGLKAADVPEDAGKAIRVQWDSLPKPPDTFIHLFVLQRAETDSGPWKTVATPETNAKFIIDDGSAGGENALLPEKNYWYRLRVEYAMAFRRGDTVVVDTANRVTVTSEKAGPVHSIPSWIKAKRLVVIVTIALLFALILIMTHWARNGKPVFVRRIAGLAAIDEAIGRATEMGKPVLYVPGTQGVDNIQTIASMIILTEVSNRTATYDVPIIVPLNQSFVVPVAEEACRTGAVNAGRPEAFVPDNIRFLSEEQFAFTAGVSGIMLREKPAANLFLGAFFAESLILSEVGFSTGAIQIAGTSNVHQLPFFVVACDYTLIGEEFFAASSYISGDPALLGTLKGTDWMKVAAMIFIGIGTLLETCGVHWLTQLLEL